MIIVMKNGTTGVSPVRSVVMRDSYFVTSISWDVTIRISRARPIMVVLGWNRCGWCGWVVGSNRPGFGRIDEVVVGLVRFRGRRDVWVGSIAGRGDGVCRIRTSFRDRNVTRVVSVLAGDRDGGVEATVGRYWKVSAL